MAAELWFHHEASAFVRKPLLVAYELGVDLVEKRVDFMSSDEMDAYAELNPNRKFPTLRDGELVLWESNAIMGYLAASHGPHLLGGDLVAKTRVAQWLFWELAHFGPTILGLSNLRLGFLPRPPRSEEDLVRELAKLLGILDRALAESPHLAGNDLTIADLAVAGDFTFATEASIPLDDLENLLAWKQRIEQRECWRLTDDRKEQVLRAAGIK